MKKIKKKSYLPPETRKIAIVYYSEDYGDFSNTIITNSITDWVEISEEDFHILNQYVNYRYRKVPCNSYRIGIIEQPLSQEKEIGKTLEDCLKLAKQAKKEQEEYDKKEIARKKKYQETKKQRELEKAKAIIEKYKNPDEYYLMDEDEEVPVDGR